MRFAEIAGSALGLSLVLTAAPFRYSDEPLKQKPAMNTAEVAVELTRFNNWLIGRHATIPGEKLPAIREHAYLIIDSIMKGQRAENRSEFNDFERSSLKTLFNWGTTLRVYGAGLAARHFARTPDEPLTDPLLPSAPFELSLEFPDFHLSSRESPWRLQIPYYFMIWEAKSFKATNGLATQLAIVSTSFADHTESGGRSQATIMFIWSPGADCAVFDAYWIEQLGMDPENKTSHSPLPGSRNYAVYAQTERMRKEVTLLGDRSGCTAFAFLGIDGTYQANRVSYLDFMRLANRGSKAAVDRTGSGLPATRPEGASACGGGPGRGCCGDAR